ncbi:MAG: hypothetical protein ACRDV0_00780, partial [Acidimicrobiales bacterium]
PSVGSPPVATTTKIYLEEGQRWVFAVALDWPGWARRARSADEAVAALDDYADRYAEVVSCAFSPGRFRVVGTLAGTATTDFGAPDARGPWDETPFSAAEAATQVGLLTDCWNYFDRVVASAPAVLRKGPRGGGRDRDKVADHVREAERAYSSGIGVRVPPRTPWAEQRATVAAGLRAGSHSPKWPTRYALRRIAWHVTDHAWEIQDRSE